MVEEKEPTLTNTTQQKQRKSWDMSDSEGPNTDKEGAQADDQDDKQSLCSAMYKSPGGVRERKDRERK